MRSSPGEQVTCRYLVLTIFGVIALVIVGLGLVFNLIFQNGFPDHGETVLRALDEDLSSLVEYYGGLDSTRVSLPPPSQSILADLCWPEIQPFMEQHDGDYGLEVVGVYGYWGTPNAKPVGSTNTIIDIVFPDGSGKPRIQMIYRNGFLYNCE